MWEHPLNGHEPLCLGDLHSDAGVASIGLRVERRKLLRRQQNAVRIVQLANQSARGLLVQRRLVNGIDEAARDDVEHLIEQAGTLLGALLLEHETTRNERDEHEAYEEAFRGSGRSALMELGGHF